MEKKKKIQREKKLCGREGKKSRGRVFSISFLINFPKLFSITNWIFYGILPFFSFFGKGKIFSLRNYIKPTVCENVFGKKFIWCWYRFYSSSQRVFFSRKELNYSSGAKAFARPGQACQWLGNSRENMNRTMLQNIWNKWQTNWQGQAIWLQITVGAVDPAEDILTLKLIEWHKKTIFSFSFWNIGPPFILILP